MASGHAGFGRLGNDEGATYGELALALGGAFGEVDLPALEAGVEHIARRLAPARDLTPYRQLVHVSDVLSTALIVCPTHRPCLDDLLYHKVAIAGRGHELTCVLVAIEAARRAGIELGLVASARRVGIAVIAFDGPELVLPERGWAVVDARTLRDESLAWICPHEAASMWLMTMRESSIAHHSLRGATTAIDLHLLLPIADRERRRLERLRAELLTRASVDPQAGSLATHPSASV